MLFVLRRLRSRSLLATAAALTVLLTAAVLCALNTFEAGVGDAGVRRALGGQDRGSAFVLVNADSTDVTARPQAEQAVRELAGRAFGPLPETVHEAAVSHSYALPGPAAGGGGAQQQEPDLTVLASLDPARVTLSVGRAPQPTAAGAPVEVAVPALAATRLGLTGGRLPAALHLVDRSTDAPLDVLVTGVYQPADPTDPYWQIDPLGGRGIRLGGYTTYGPLLTPDAAFSSGRLPQQGLDWVVTADFSRVHASSLDALGARLPGLLADFRTGTGFTATSPLPATLTTLHNDLLAARSTLVIGAVQLVVLAVGALLLVTRLLTARQAAEDALLTARGATWQRVAGLTALEAALLALPAALLAPPLTPLLVRLIDRTGPLTRAGVRLGGGIPAACWPIALAVAAGAVLVVLLPTAARAAGSALRGRVGRVGFGSRPARSGADLALLALAVLGYLQLAHYGSGSGHPGADGTPAPGGGALTADASGRLGLDPLLAAAPALALCAGTALAIRLLPPAARLAERWIRGGRGLSAALAGWQLARRPRHTAGPVLLLVFAVSMGLLALGQAASLNTSQHDQAEYGTAGGLRVTGLPVPAPGQSGLLTTAPGGTRFLPVSRQPLPLNSGRTAQLLALDGRSAATELGGRADLTRGHSPAALLAPLAAPAPTGAAPLVLPGQPTALQLDVTVATEAPAQSPFPLPGAPPPGMVASPDGPSVTLELHDRLGVAFTVTSPTLPAQGDGSLRIDLGAALGTPAGRAAYPLTLTAIDVSSDTSSTFGGAVALTVHRISSVDAAGHATALAATAPSTAAPTAAGPGWDAATTSKNALTAKTFRLDPPTGGDLLRIGKMVGFVGVRLTPTGSGTAPATVPALASSDFLSATGSAVGQQVSVQLGTGRIDLTVTGVLPALPTTGDDGGGPTAAVLVDLDTVNRALTAAGGAPLDPTEWWLPATGPGDPVPAQAAAALQRGTLPAQFQLNTAVLATLRSDPLATAAQSALLALTATAVALAAIGFVAAAVGAAAERAGEFAVLRAIGTPHRQLARTTAAEQALLIGFGLGLGTLLGTVLVHLVVPDTVLTATAHRPVPPVLVELPLWQALGLLAATAALPALVTAHRMLRRPRAAETTARLRHSEEM
ncbi:FtsX-like permease family protein [Kitasatospora sp. LaBMicrA B282]|uniref:FtsX-like permease family protein n=1 Tax=Kitasatospora sp. LaBMicrA B282 TaxID=3420949 RepID=UPI003D0F3B5C